MWEEDFYKCSIQLSNLSWNSRDRVKGFLFSTTGYPPVYGHMGVELCSFMTIWYFRTPWGTLRAAWLGGSDAQTSRE